MRMGTRASELPEELRSKIPCMLEHGCAPSGLGPLIPFLSSDLPVEFNREGRLKLSEIFIQ
jgi:hypothetical protein